MGDDSKLIYPSDQWKNVGVSFPHFANRTMSFEKVKLVSKIAVVVISKIPMKSSTTNDNKREYTFEWKLIQNIWNFVHVLTIQRSTELVSIQWIAQGECSDKSLKMNIACSLFRRDNGGISCILCILHGISSQFK